MQGIISHKFFKNYNFDALMKLMIKPKFIPKETVEKMISPDNYYELFDEDANSLPWIPVIK